MLEIYPPIEHMTRYEYLQFEVITLDKNKTTSILYDDIFIKKISDSEYGVYYDYTNEVDIEEEWYKLKFGEDNNYLTYKKRNKVNIIGKDGKLRARIGSISSHYNFRDEKGAVNLSWLQRIFVERRQNKNEPWDILRWYPSRKKNIKEHLFDYTKLNTNLINVIDKLIVHNYNTT